MGVGLAKPRYRVDLCGLQATCEANYYRLLRSKLHWGRGSAER